MTPLNDNPILVIGATGRQGGASARHLLDTGWRVRALVRDPAAPAARSLAERGVELVQGDLDIPESIQRAVGGAYGVHSVQAYMPKDPDREVHQGAAVIDAAKAAGVRHFVYSSAAGADRHIGIPETESKWTIEEHLRSSGLPSTILRPAYFMDNFTFLRSWIMGGTWTMPLPSDRKLQMIATDDIGAFVALALGQPSAFIGEVLEIAADELTMDGIGEVLSRIVGREVRFSEMPIEHARAFDPDLATLCEWLKTHDFGADVSALRTRKPDLLTLDDWLTKTGWGEPVEVAVGSPTTA